MAAAGAGAAPPESPAGGPSVAGGVPALEDLPPHNCDGVGGMHVYVPWWLDNRTLDFPRGYHVELGGGKRMPGYGFGAGIEQIQGEIMRELERRFSPEFRNRIDEVVIFSPLSRDEVRQIALQQIERIEQTLARSARTLNVTPAALEQIVTEGYNLAYGARFLKRVIDDRLKLPLSQQWKEAVRFRATLRDGVVAVEPMCLTAAASEAAVAV